MLDYLNRIRATLLGGAAALAGLCFSLTVAGTAWLCVAILYLGDHEAGGVGSYAPSAAFALASAIGCLLSCRLGWKVGWDWYRNGR